MAEGGQGGFDCLLEFLLALLFRQEELPSRLQLPLARRDLGLEFPMQSLDLVEVFASCFEVDVNDLFAPAFTCVVALFFAVIMNNGLCCVTGCCKAKPTAEGKVMPEA